MDYVTCRNKIESLANADSSDIDWLFCEVLKIKRSELARIKIIDKTDYKKLVYYAKKLKRGMPLSIALGFTEFCDNTIMVSSKVLTPRFETEELTSLVIKEILNNPKPVKVLDLCCGSGAIGVSIKKKCKSLANITSSDISRHAIKFTKKNAKINQVDIHIIKSDMFKNIWGHFDYIVCNPPYISYGDPEVQKNVNEWEPHLALYAPENGYKFYKILSQQAKNYLFVGGKLCLEVGHTMAKTVAQMFKDNYATNIIKDINGIERFVIITKK